MRWVLALLLVPLCALAAPPPVITGVVIVGRAEPGGAWSDQATQARQGDDAQLAVVLVGSAGKTRLYLADDEIAPLFLGGKRVPDAARRDFASLGGEVFVRWSKVEPHAWRGAGLVAPNGSPTPYYSNVATGGDKHGAWLGYDRITYFETPLDGSARRRAADVAPTDKEADRFGGLGTMRYKIAVRLPDGRTLATPGAEATDTYGIKRSVHRVSIRRDDSFNGWLSAYFLVPEVFGSAGPGRDHQAERYTGADCADVLVGALRSSGHAVDYSHVAGLTDYADVVVAPVELDDDGHPSQVIEGVRPGDLIRIDYGGQWAGMTRRTWDHIAVLWEDRSDPAGPSQGRADGRLDGFDLVVHMGHPRLVLEELREQTPARIDVLRWSEKKLGPARRAKPDPVHRQ